MENKLYCDDCFKVLPNISSNSINLILCDLPYGTTQNKWDTELNLKQLWREYERIIVDNGVVILTSHGLFTAKLIMSNPIMFKYKLVWVKSKATNWLNCKKQPLRKHEDILVFYHNQPTYNPQMSKGEPYYKGVMDSQTGSYGRLRPVVIENKDGSRYPNDVLYFKTAESEGKVYHSTQKPLSLSDYLIKTYTNKGDIVLDNCCGSGTFLLSAKRLKRKYIGIEINEEYYNIAKQRLKEYQSTLF